MISRVRQALGVEVALGEVFDPARAGGLRAGGADGGAGGAAADRARVDRDGRLPLSFAQQRLWFLEQLGGLGSTYHIPSACGCAARWTAAALRARAGRHRARATRRCAPPSRRWTGCRSSASRRRRRAGSTSWSTTWSGRGGRGRGAGRRMVEEAHAPFDLQRGPLIRGRLVRLAADDHVLLLTMHHIVTDAWSMGVLIGELSALYAAHRGAGSRTLARAAGAVRGLRGVAAALGGGRRPARAGGLLDARRSRAPRSCWSCPRTARGRRGGPRGGAARGGAGRGADGGAQGAVAAPRHDALHDAAGRVGRRAGPALRPGRRGGRHARWPAAGGGRSRG